MTSILIHLARPAAAFLVAAATMLVGHQPGRQSSSDPGRLGRTTPAVATITATDFAFDAPDTVPSGLVTLRLLNRGLASHHVTMVRLEGGRTLRELEKALVGDGRLPSWAVDVGGPTAAAPGAASEVTVTLHPGRHVLLCAIRLPDGTLALMRGMYRQLDVRGPAGRALPEVPDAVVRIDERGPNLQGALKRGRRHLRVVNAAEGSRELRLYRVAGARSEAELRAWLANEVGAAPATAVGGVTALAAGGSAMASVPLERGLYLLVSRPPELRRNGAGPARVLVQRVRVE